MGGKEGGKGLKKKRKRTGAKFPRFISFEGVTMKRKIAGPESGVNAERPNQAPRLFQG